jgi:hypothetical protein
MFNPCSFLVGLRKGQENSANIHVFVFLTPTKHPHITSLEFIATSICLVAQSFSSVLKGRTIQKSNIYKFFLIHNISKHHVAWLQQYQLTNFKDSPFCKANNRWWILDQRSYAVEAYTMPSNYFSARRNFQIKILHC